MKIVDELFRKFLIPSIKMSRSDKTFELCIMPLVMGFVADDQVLNLSGPMPHRMFNYGALLNVKIGQAPANNHQRVRPFEAEFKLLVRMP